MRAALRSDRTGNAPRVSFSSSGTSLKPKWVVREEDGEGLGGVPGDAASKDVRVVENAARAMWSRGRRDAPAMAVRRDDDERIDMMVGRENVEKKADRKFSISIVMARPAQLGQRRRS